MGRWLGIRIGEACLSGGAPFGFKGAGFDVSSFLEAAIAVLAYNPLARLDGKGFSPRFDK